jgi:hypothetical protein
MVDGLGRGKERASMARTDDPRDRRPLAGIGLLVYILGWSWPFVLMACGVSRDRYRISLGDKLLLTILSILSPIAVGRFGGRRRQGCATALGCYCVMAVAVLWWWNGFGRVLRNPARGQQRRQHRMALGFCNR